MSFCRSVTPLSQDPEGKNAVRAKERGAIPEYKLRSTIARVVYHSAEATDPDAREF